MNFLQNMSMRERALIYIAAGLLFIFALWQFGMKPLLDSKADAARTQAVAARDLDIVRQGLPRMGNAAAAAGKAGFGRAGVITAAKDANVIISRVQPGLNGALQVWFEDAPAQNIYAFITAMNNGYAVTFQRVQLTRQDGGGVAAQLTLAPQ